MPPQRDSRRDKVKASLRADEKQDVAGLMKKEGFARKDYENTNMVAKIKSEAKKMREALYPGEISSTVASNGSTTISSKKNRSFTTNASSSSSAAAPKTKTFIHKTKTLVFSR